MTLACLPQRFVATIVCYHSCIGGWSSFYYRYRVIPPALLFRVNPLGCRTRQLYFTLYTLSSDIFISATKATYTLGIREWIASEILGYHRPLGKTAFIQIRQERHITCHLRLAKLHCQVLRLSYSFMYLSNNLILLSRDQSPSSSNMCNAPS